MKNRIIRALKNNKVLNMIVVLVMVFSFVPISFAGLIEKQIDIKDGKTTKLYGNANYEQTFDWNGDYSQDFYSNEFKLQIDSEILENGGEPESYELSQKQWQQLYQDSSALSMEEGYYFDIYPKDLDVNSLDDQKFYTSYINVNVPTGVNDKNYTRIDEIPEGDKKADYLPVIAPQYIVDNLDFQVGGVYDYDYSKDYLYKLIDPNDYEPFPIQVKIVGTYDYDQEYVDGEVKYYGSVEEFYTKNALLLSDFDAVNNYFNLYDITNGTDLFSSLDDNYYAALELPSNMTENEWKAEVKTALGDEFTGRFNEPLASETMRSRMINILYIVTSISSLLIFMVIIIIVLRIRSKELIVYRSLGLEKKHIMSQLLVENMLMSTCASLFSMGASYFLLEFAHRNARPWNNYLLKLDLSIDIFVIMKALIIALVITIVATIIPARFKLKRTK